MASAAIQQKQKLNSQHKSKCEWRMDFFNTNITKFQQTIRTNHKQQRTAVRQRLREEKTKPNKTKYNVEMWLLIWMEMKR